MTRGLSGFLKCEHYFRRTESWKTGRNHLVGDPVITNGRVCDDNISVLNLRHYGSARTCPDDRPGTGHGEFLKHDHRARPAYPVRGNRQVQPLPRTAICHVFAVAADLA